MKVDEIRPEPATRNGEACRLADAIRRRLDKAMRGVTRASSGIFVAFGHDYAERGYWAQAKETIDTIRRECLITHEEGGWSASEMGFGVDCSGNTWAMMIRVEGNQERAWEYLWSYVMDGALRGTRDEAASVALDLMAIAFVGDLGFPDRQEPESTSNLDITIR